jgi:hypothetical protein
MLEWLDVGGFVTLTAGSLYYMFTVQDLAVPDSDALGLSSPISLFLLALLGWLCALLLINAIRGPKAARYAVAAVLALAFMAASVLLAAAGAGSPLPWWARFDIQLRQDRLTGT